MAASALCLVCKEALPDPGSCPMCSECSYGYHIGPCSGVTKSAFKTGDEAVKKAWKCQACVILAARANAGSGKLQLQQTSDTGKILAEINRKLSEIPTIKSRIDQLMQLKDTVQNMEQSVKHLSEQYDDVLIEMRKQSCEIATLKKRVEKAEAANDPLEIQKLRQHLNYLEQYSRRQNLEIHGIPHSQGEQLLGKLNNLAKQLNLAELTPANIDGLHRLPPKPGKEPAVLVRFVSCATRNEWMAKKGYLKSSKSDVYFLDNLTAENRKLLWLMRARAQEKHYQFVWQKEGKMFVRKAQGERAIRIECQTDLDKIQ
ncbi:uncharacterized protein LOC119160770 [Rhipicephalus microplus]|uniref:uncharacterized protein LOC119160770 n=1 Tax=Rhipicephalus microplus TaxID=6941 RepID=UPI001887D7E6|nr:uncharacterized protein LOC119160770 [Rhipicephalus microplus]XP_037287299.1 uncharacterized protein LOC119180251 [Rhipicephalus microplus]